MLAGELALAGVDVAIVERRVRPAPLALRAGGRTPAPSRSSISAESPIGSFRRGEAVQVGQLAGRLDISDIPTRLPTGSGCGRTTSSAYWPWVGELAVTIYRGRGDGFAQDDSGVDVEAADASRRAAR